MRTNGSFRYEILTDSGLNEYGEPIQGVSSWSEPIPCSIKTNSSNRKGKYEDSEFRQASFIVLIEDVENIAFDRIKLERYSEDLGEYRIISYEPLKSVGRIQIMV